MAAGHPSMTRSLQICVVYAITSVVISTIYKLLLSVYKFDAKFTMLSYQLVLSLLFCAFAKKWLGGIPGLEVPDFKQDILLKSIAPGMMFTINIVIGWYGMELVSVPLFLCIRRTTTAFTLLAEWLLLGRFQSSTVQASIAIIVTGAVIAGWESLRSDFLGIAYTFGNNLCTAASMSLTKRFSDSTRVSGFGILMYNAVIALPLCLAGATLRGEWAYIASFEHVGSASFWVSLTCASALGCFMTYIVFLCTTVNSPLATSVTGNAKDIIGTFVGAIAFNDFKPTAYSVTGIAISFLGAAAFSGAKLAEMRSDAAKPMVQTAPEVDVNELSPRELDAFVSRSAASPGGRRNLADSVSVDSLPVETVHTEHDSVSRGGHYQRQTATESSAASHVITAGGQGPSLPGDVTRRGAIIVAAGSS